MEVLDNKYDEFREFVIDKVAPLLCDDNINNALNLSPVSNLRKTQEISVNIQSDKIVSIYIEEGIQTLKTIEGYYNHNSKLLEIGGGIGIVNVWLQHKGYSIVSIEPSDDAHSDYYEIGSHIINSLSLDQDKWLSLEVEDLDKINDKYDLIFSNNVLEHLSDLKLAFKRMSEKMEATGLMRHNCPNYQVPYEPHFGIFLIPGMEKKMPVLFPYLRDDHLWKSLNFIKSSSVKNICTQLNLCIKFDEGVFYKTVKRLYSDINFLQRHKFLSVLLMPFKYKIFNKILMYLPAQISTPMVISVKNN